ncbi:hypothetical protein [Oceanobacter mangrovi]|uniref:hypothetical protein n=1 Tax=Oceanobacter mangrovi TaxID=2862510 RepID=UPI001C8E3F27|nr:hypothetical protein [Oceanobacter mangrovi]
MTAATDSSAGNGSNESGNSLAVADSSDSTSGNSSGEAALAEAIRQFEQAAQGVDDSSSGSSFDALSEPDNSAAASDSTINNPLPESRSAASILAEQRQTAEEKKQQREEQQQETITAAERFAEANVKLRQATELLLQVSQLGGPVDIKALLDERI